VIVETDRSLPIVHFGVSTRSGAALDANGLEGLTRLTTRLMRRSAGGMNADEIDALVDRLGASMAAEVSNSTAGFSGSVIKRSFEKVIDLLADTLTRPALPEAELGLLKRETEAELLEAKDNDRSLASHWFRKKMFARHAYGRSTVGTSKSLQAISKSDIESSYRRAYVTQNLVFCFAGEISDSEATNAVKRLTQGLPSGPLPVDPTPEPEPTPGRRLVIVDKPERTQTQIIVGCLGTQARDLDHFPLLIANTAFGGTFTARLTQEVRAKRGWSYGAHSSLPSDRRRQAFSMWTFPKAEDSAACVELEIKLLEDWWEHGITNEELGWIKLYLARSYAFVVDTCAKRANLKLDQILYDLPAGYYENYIERVNAVTLDQANAAIRNRISTRDLLITVVGTESVIGGALREKIADLASVEVVPYNSD
jgi:zinc protease